MAKSPVLVGFPFFVSPLWPDPLFPFLSFLAPEASALLLRFFLFALLFAQRFFFRV